LQGDHRGLVVRNRPAQALVDRQGGGGEVADRSGPPVDRQEQEARKRSGQTARTARRPDTEVRHRQEVAGCRQEGTGGQEQGQLGVGRAGAQVGEFGEREEASGVAECSGKYILM
jgi:hypothetical protein